MQVVIENLHFFISSEICQISDEIKSPAGQKALRKTVVLFRRISTEDKNRRQRAGQRTLSEPEASPCRKQREAYEKEKSIGEPACLAFGEGRNLPGSLFIRN